MKQILFILSFLLCNALTAQIYVYEGNDPIFGEVLCNVNGGHILPEREMIWSSALLTATKSHIYSGFSTSHFDVAYTYENGSLYLGDSIFTSDILYTWKNGVIYKGDSTFPLDRVCSFKNGKVYGTAGESIFDVLITIGGDVTVPELMAVLLALEMI